MASKKNRGKKINHIQHQIPPSAHTPMYVWHKYWGRKPWNVVADYIKTYSQPGEIVIDPFSGSGVTAIEAIRHKRKAIAIDLNPVATAIIRSTVTHVEPQLILNSFKKVEAKVKAKIQALYTTKCRGCGGSCTLNAAVYKRKQSNIEIHDIRYSCQHCGHVATKGESPNKDDASLLTSIKNTLATSSIWYPKNRLYYNGLAFQKKEHYESINEMFTDRNLFACALIMDAIEKEPDETLKLMLKSGFSSCVHLCTTMMPVRESRDISGCWTQHSYWYARTFLEQNVWDKFQSAIVGKQGLIKAKEESNKALGKVRIAKNLSDVFQGKADIYISCSSALTTLETIKQKKFKVNYCFTDPPYNGTIQYGELSYLWAAWLKLDGGYVEKLIDDEVIENRHQNKDFDTYHTLLRSTFRAIYDVLQPNAYCHVTFTNPKTKYRNMTLNSAMFAGFDFEEIHHQESARPSAKSLLQPFGSVNGDFFLRFCKNENFDLSSKQRITLKRFETVVINSAKKVILHRAEPTSYTSIIEEVDKALYNEGFYIESQSAEFDVQKVMKRAVGKELTLIDKKIGKVTGQLWWLSDAALAKSTKIPLHERVDAVVLDLLKKNYSISFNDVWREVAMTFPNSLTPDTSDIRKTLEDYACKAGKDSWRMKPKVKEQISQHSDMIAIICDLGIKSGFKVHVGTREQRETAKYQGKSIQLKTLSSESTPELKGINRNILKSINNIDAYWYKSGKIVACFEVENSTSITSALERVSSIPYDVDKFLILPDDRENQLAAKLKLEMFKETFEASKWSVLYYNTLLKNRSKLVSGATSLNKISGKTSTEFSEQTSIFEQDNAS